MRKGGREREVRTDVRQKKAIRWTKHEARIGRERERERERDRDR